MPKKAPTDRGRGQIQRRGDDKYLLRVFLGRNPDGSRKYSSKMFRGSSTQARRELTKLLNAVDTGAFVEPSKQTLSEYIEHWLTDSDRLRVSERTLEDYAHRIRRDALTRIGHRKLDKLSIQDIQACTSELVKWGLSARTVRYTHSILKQALKKAVVNGLLLRNPAEYVDLPRNVRREMAVLRPEQVHCFLAGTEGDDWHALWTVLLLAGLRPAEALGLKWSDLEGNRLKVARALKKGAADTYFLGDPKTSGSRRVVKLNQQALDALQSHRSRQAAHRLRTGSRYSQNDLIFANSIGQPMDLSKVRRLFKRALVTVGLPPIRLYDLRHTHATMMLQADVNPKVVSKRLGHTNIAMTLGAYSHVLPHMQDASIEKLDRLLSRAAS